MSNAQPFSKVSKVQINAMVDPALPIGPQVLGVLRDKILFNDLEPGAAISEPGMAKTLGISRQPVREAFIKLSKMGLLTIRPQRRTIVSKISVSAVLDARFVREAIEADIVTLLAQKPDHDLVARLRGLLEQQMAVKADTFEFMRLDDQFHRNLAEAANKPNVWHFIEDLKTQMDRIRILRAQSFPNDKLVFQHQTIVDHIEKGEVLACQAAMRAHLQELPVILPIIYQSFPDYFEDPETIGVS